MTCVVPRVAKECVRTNLVERARFERGGGKKVEVLTGGRAISGGMRASLRSGQLSAMEMSR